MRETDELLTVPEVAEQLRVKSPTIIRWIKAGALDAVILPHKNKRTGYRVKKSVVDGLLAQKAV